VIKHRVPNLLRKLRPAEERRSLLCCWKGEWWTSQQTYHSGMNQHR
jgi:hypothetical protein